MRQSLTGIIFAISVVQEIPMIGTRQIRTPLDSRQSRLLRFAWHRDRHAFCVFSKAQDFS